MGQNKYCNTKPCNRGVVAGLN